MEHCYTGLQVLSLIFTAFVAGMFIAAGIATIIEAVRSPHD